MNNHLLSNNKHKFASLIFIFLAIILFVSLYTYNREDIEIILGGTGQISHCANFFGRMGAVICHCLLLLFGFASWSLILIFGVISFSLLITPLAKENKSMVKHLYLPFSLIFLSIVMIFGLLPDFLVNIQQSYNISTIPGGVIGKVLCDPQKGIVYYVTNFTGSLFIAIMIAIFSLVYLFLKHWHILFVKHNNDNKASVAPVVSASVKVVKKEKELLPKEEPKPVVKEEKEEEGKEKLYVRLWNWLFKSNKEEEEDKPAPITGIERTRPNPFSNMNTYPEEFSNTSTVANFHNSTINTRVPNDRFIPKEPVPVKVTVATPTVSQVPIQEVPVVNNNDIAKQTVTQQVSTPNVVNATVPVNSQSVFVPYTPEKPLRDDEFESGTTLNNYQLPPLDLLAAIPAVQTAGATSEEIIMNQQIILETLESFKIKITNGNVFSGPRVTLYEIMLENGVRVENVSKYQSNLTMKLCAQSLRILAPIPGKDSVGIEVPNKKPTNVLFKEILASQEWHDSQAKIPLALGRNVVGKISITDLAKTPHLLVAGATGTGKSVCLNSFLMSMLYKFSPDDLKLILIDPKGVEFAPYHKIPHLIVPVIADVSQEPTKVSQALRWAINEMERRYNLLKKVNCRNLDGFNGRRYDPTILDDFGNPLPEKLPYIVIVIDELADIMMTIGKEVEGYLARIAQKSRAIGIHMILATQRPSVNVITGVIKANIPARVAFMVSSLVDSRTILDGKGAESLLGNGDLLYKSGSSPNLERSQGAFISDKEVEDIANFVAQQQPQNFDETVFVSLEDKCDDDDYDDIGPSSDFSQADSLLIEKSIKIILRDKAASIGHIQRRLKIGYNKAATIIEEIERRGIIGPQKPGGSRRDILVDESEYLDEEEF